MTKKQYMIDTMPFHKFMILDIIHIQIILFL